MENTLDKLIEEFRNLGLKDYIIIPTDGKMVIKIPNGKLNQNDETNLIREFGVTVEVTDLEITIIY